MLKTLWSNFYTRFCRDTGPTADDYVYADWLYKTFVNETNACCTYNEFLQMLYTLGYQKKKRGYPFKIESIVGLKIFAFNPLIEQVQRAKEFIKYNESADLAFACRTLALAPPVYLTNITTYRDGGTLGFLFTDTKGLEITFCLDGRIGADGKGKDIYYGVSYPVEHGRKLKKGDLQAQALAILLTGFYNLKEYEQFEIDGHHILRTINALRRFNNDG